MLEHIYALVSALDRKSALDSVQIAERLDAEVRSTSALLSSLYRVRRIQRFPTNTYRDKCGRRRQTYAYYAGTPARRAKPKVTAPFTHTSLTEHWPCRL